MERQRQNDMGRCILAICVLVLSLSCISPAHADEIPIVITAGVGNAPGAGFVQAIGPGFSFFGAPVEDEFLPESCLPGTLCVLSSFINTGGYLSHASYNGLQTPQTNGMSGRVFFTSTILLPNTQLSPGPFIIPATISSQELIAFECPIRFVPGECSNTTELFTFTVSGTGLLEGNVLPINESQGRDVFGQYHYSFVGEASITQLVTPEPPGAVLLGTGILSLLAITLRKRRSAAVCA
jgi:hypothetical protein